MKYYKIQLPLKRGDREDGLIEGLPLQGEF
jgi:hypothetical protein